MSTPGSGNLNASTFSRNPNNFLQQFEQFTMVGWQKKTKKKNSANPLAFVFFDPNISLFPFYDLCVCVFFWFLCFFCFCLLEMANRRTRIPNRRHHTSTITGPTTNKTFSDRLPFYFHLFFFWFLPPKSCVFLGSWFLGTDERKQNVSMVFLLFFWSSGQLGSLVGSLLRTVGAAAALRQLRHGDQSENDAADAADTVEYPRHRPPRWTFFFFLCHRTFYLERVVLPRNSNPSFSETFFLLLVCLASDFSSTPEELARHGMAKDLNSAMGSSFDGVDFFPSDDALRGEGPRSKNPNPMNVAFVVVCCFHVR